MSRANEAKYIIKVHTYFDDKWHQRTVYAVDARRYARQKGITTEDAAIRMVWEEFDDAGIACSSAMMAKFVPAKPNANESMSSYLGRLLLPPRY